eukprot:PhM_4_TR127/c0_g1_i1/m.6767
MQPNTDNDDDDVNHSIVGIFNAMTINVHTADDILRLESKLAETMDTDITTQTLMQVIDHLADSPAGKIDAIVLALGVLSTACSADENKAFLSQHDTFVLLLANIMHTTTTTTTNTTTANIAESHQKSVVYRTLDVLTTLMIDSDAVRAALGNVDDDCSFIPTVLGASRKFKSDIDVHFAVCCALATLCFNSAKNSRNVCRAGGYQLLLELFKFAAKKVKTSEPDGSSAVDHVLQWSRLALRNIATSGGHNAEVRSTVLGAGYGRFGDIVQVDELKWELQHAAAMDPDQK